MICLFAFLQSCTDHCTLTNNAMGTIYDGTCPNILRGDKFLIPITSLIVSQLLPQPLDLSQLPDGRSKAYSGGCLHIFLIFYFYYLICLCNILTVSALLVAIGPWSFKEDYFYCPFDYTTFVVSGNVGIP